MQTSTCRIDAETFPVPSSEYSGDIAEAIARTAIKVWEDPDRRFTRLFLYFHGDAPVLVADYSEESKTMRLGIGHSLPPMEDAGALAGYIRCGMEQWAGYQKKAAKRPGAKTRDRFVGALRAFTNDGTVGSVRTDTLERALAEGLVNGGEVVTFVDWLREEGASEFVCRRMITNVLECMV